MKHLKKVLGIIYILSVLSSCTKEKEYPKPCLVDCETKFHLIYKMAVLPVTSGMKKYLKRHREIFNQ